MRSILSGLVTASLFCGCVSSSPDEQTVQKSDAKGTQSAQLDEPKLDVIPASGEREAPAGDEGFQTTASGLQYKIIKPGGARKPKPTSTVTCHYKGWLDNGREFDSSYKRNEPTSFPLNGVIKGWTEGLQLIGEGGEIELVIPSKIGYGAGGMPPVIPPNATLHFKIELISIK